MWATRNNGHIDKSIRCHWAATLLADESATLPYRLCSRGKFPNCCRCYCKLMLQLLLLPMARTPRGERPWCSRRTTQDHAVRILYATAAVVLCFDTPQTRSSVHFEFASSGQESAMELGTRPIELGLGFRLSGLRMLDNVRNRRAQHRRIHGCSRLRSDRITIIQRSLRQKKPPARFAI